MSLERDVPRPRRRFGQNFLHDPVVLNQIAGAINPQPGQAMLEIGPGRGALTEHLLDSGVHLTAVELDRDLADLLRRSIHNTHFRLVEADALKLDLQCLDAEVDCWRVVGNLPYNISTPLLFHLLAQRESISDMHFLLQREVVQRLAASPGTKAYGRLGVMMQFHCEVEPLHEVGPGAFVPAPKVVSQLVRLRPRQLEPARLALEASLDHVLRTAFSQRRKTLRRALKALFSIEQLEAVGIDASRRPDTLELQEFMSLARLRDSEGG